jgi:CDP-diacylglycerol--serine O-phosphatidyltransferase
VLIAAVLTYPWITLVALCAAYIVGVVWGSLRRPG